MYEIQILKSQNKDNFVKRLQFESLRDQLNNEIKILNNKIEANLDRQFELTDVMNEYIEL